MAISLEKFIPRFVEESRANIQLFEEGLADLEGRCEDQELINGLFRAIHTIKGASRMLKLTPITDGAHKTEDVLDALRSGELKYTQDIGLVLQAAGDMITAQIEAVEETGAASPPEPGTMNALAKIFDHQTPEETQACEKNDTPILTGPLEKDAADPDIDTKKQATLRTSDMVRVQRTKLDELIKLMGEIVSSHGRLHQRLKEIKRYERFQETARQQNISPVHTFVKKFQDDVFDQQLLMEELHSKALVMRMLPVSIVFEPAARLVREVSRTLGKKVSCRVKGADIELDRQIIDKLSDPMVHLIRNAVDHGLETPEQRLAAGKNPTGEIVISAQQDGGWVLIEIRDDGKGIYREAITKKVLEKRLVTRDALEAMTKKQIMNLIFMPGFSTSAMITDISGRGVGLDVVKRNILDDMNGRIDMRSEPGSGTVFQLRLPLSLAVMKVLLVDVAGRTFGFTAQNIFCLIKIPEHKIQRLAERKVITLYNEFIPLFDLSQLLGIEGSAPTPIRPVVVVQVQNQKVALAVDGLVDELDMVIKPLPEHLQPVRLLSGMVMTGKNELVSILHIPVLMEIAAGQAGDRTANSGTDRDNQWDHTNAPHILVVDDSLNTREIEKSILEAHGFHVTLAEDGQDGLNKAMNKNFDAVLTDVEMPIMDGFSLTKALRECDQYAYLPIIIITSRAKEDDRRRGMEAGADAYIVKGDFEKNNLIDTLQALLGR